MVRLQTFENFAFENLTQKVRPKITSQDCPSSPKSKFFVTVCVLGQHFQHNLRDITYCYTLLIYITTTFRIFSQKSFVTLVYSTLMNWIIECNFISATKLRRMGKMCNTLYSLLLDWNGINRLLKGLKIMFVRRY